MAMSTAGAARRWPFGRRVSVVGLALWCWALTGVVTASEAPLAVEELTRRAELIVIGEVISVASELFASEGQIITRIDVRVEEVLKGPAGQAPLQLQQAGGRVGEVRREVAGMPAFTQGERVLLFLGRRGDGGLAVVGLFQGKFTLQRDESGREIAARRVPGSGEEVDRLPLDDVRSAIASSR
jgi:hypothetical protein